VTPVPVVLAVDGTPADTALLAALDAGPRTVVVRRCVDATELLGAAGARQAAVAVVDGGLRGLDADVVDRLHAIGVRIVLLQRRGAPTGFGALVARIVEVPGGLGSTTDEATFAARLVDEVTAAASEPPRPAPARARPGEFADPRAPAGTASDDGLGADADGLLAGPQDRTQEVKREASGVVVAVWGPPGAPGRTTVAINLADLLARRARVLLVDADTFAASVAPALAVLDESSGLAAACRHAAAGRLDAAALARCARSVDGLAVLTGIEDAARWPEVSASAWETVLDVARRCFDVVVIDCAAGLGQDEEAVFDSLAPRRNAATLTALDVADEVVVVGGADPVALQRLVLGVRELRETVPDARHRVLVNRVPRDAAARRRREVADLLQRHATLDVEAFLPEDAACRVALDEGRTLRDVAPSSALCAAISAVADGVLGQLPAVAATGSDTGSAAGSSSFLRRIRKVPARPRLMKPAPTQTARAVDSA
jgi:MinD-like ATPase involved in chromosome partitioning or flagellar assembly